MDIKPYVAVGPTEELSISVHKDTFDAAFILFTVLFGLFLLVTVGVIIFFAFRASEIPPPPLPLTPVVSPVVDSLHSNKGAMTSTRSSIEERESIPTTKRICTTLPNARWKDGRCECISPFFGNNCEREKHDKRYYSVGTPRGDVRLSIIDKGESDGKSFGLGRPCSRVCDETSGCVGFMFEKPGICTLLDSDVVVGKGATISYSENEDSTLYMRSSDNLQFESYVFLGRYPNSFPPRYWLESGTSNYLRLSLQKIYRLSFFPTYSKIFGELLGLYCPHQFSKDEIPILLRENRCYIHDPRETINIPSHWQYKLPLFVIYVPRNILKSG